MSEEHSLRIDNVSDPRVLLAMHRVPREEFVPAEYRRQAYGDHPLPIGHGQTISQPSLVALMTQLLELDGHEKVLEIGTGSGYQAAILSQVAAEVHTVEVIPELVEAAATRLSRLGYDNVHVHPGDGNNGWPASAPYDAIIVTATAPAIPQPLFGQLSQNGVLVAPVGSYRGPQVLERHRMVGAKTEREVICPVAFVPLVQGKDREPLT